MMSLDNNYPSFRLYMYIEVVLSYTDTIPVSLLRARPRLMLYHAFIGLSLE